MKRYPLIILPLILLSLIFVHTSSGKEEGKKVFLTYNPHLAMFKDKKINNDVCLLCHSVKHTSEPKITGQRKYLTEDVNVICAGCHGFNPHVGARRHLVKPTSKIRKRIKAWEKKTGNKLRLDDKNRITCSTCHSPHPAGMLQALNSEAYKDTVDHMKKYSAVRGKGTLELNQMINLQLFAENMKRFKKHKIFAPPISDEVNRIQLPFRQDMSGGKFCLICHDIYD